MANPRAPPPCRTDMQTAIVAAARARRAVSAIFFINGAVLASWVAHIPSVKAQHGIGDGGLGLVLLSMAVGSVLTLPIAGWLIARWGSRVMTTAAALAFSLALPLPVISPTVSLAVLTLALLGACNALLDVCPGVAAMAVAIVAGVLGDLPSSKEHGRPHPVLVRPPAALEVDALDGARVEVGPGAEPADRGDRVHDPDAARDHLGEHRLEDDVVVPADEPELHFAAVELTPEQLLERQRGVDAAEAATEDDDARGSCACHRLPPEALANRRSLDGPARTSSLLFSRRLHYS